MVEPKSIVFAILGIIFIIIGVFELRKVSFRSINSKDKCPFRPDECGSDTSCCAIWDGSQCRKGKLRIEGANKYCISNRDYGPIVSFFLAAVFIVSAFIYRKA